MAWQCMKCLHHIPNGASHSCINDELRDLQKQYAEAVKLIEEMAKAIEPALEYMKSSKHPICGCDMSVNFYCPECCIEISFDDALSRAKDIIGDSNG